MKNDLTCAVVTDLLPSYADGVTNEETNVAVERHLERCETCAAALRAMRAPEPEPPAKKDEQEIAFLKKVKKNRIRAAVCAALAMLLLAGTVFGVFWFNRAYHVKIPVTADDIDCFLTYEQVGDAEKVLLNGELTDENMTSANATRMDFNETTGQLTMTFYMRKARKNESRKISAAYTAQQKINSVYIGDIPIWENGVMISKTAGRVFAAAHPYMGDIMQNLKSAGALGIVDTFGSFTNEMFTSREPFSWELTFKDPFADTAAWNRAALQTDAVLLLATIGNLDTVSFCYTQNGTAQTYIITAAEADALLGRSVKEAGQTPSGVQELLDALRSLAEQDRTADQQTETAEK